MGWACRKSGIVLAHGLRLIGRLTLKSSARCVAVDHFGEVSWRPPLGSTTSNGHKRVLTPTFLCL